MSMQRNITIDAGCWGALTVDFSDEPRFSQMRTTHSHADWEVFCWLGSRMTYHLDEKSLRVPHCAVIPVPPGVSHRTEYSPDELRWKLDIRFEDRFFDIFPTEAARAQVRGALGKGMLTVSVKWANTLRQAVIDALLNPEEGNPLSAAKAAFAVASILTGIAQAAAETEGKTGAVGMRQSHIATAMDIIDKDYASDISLQTLADRLHLTKTYICHIFRDVLGMTVSQCVHARRIRAARILLLETSAPVAEIAEQVGFGSVNYFTKCFRAEEGLTPSQYRAIVRGRK